MANKGASGATIGDQTTVAEVIKMLEAIEWQCRRARLLLKGLDRKTPIKVTRELKAMLKAPAPDLQGMAC